MDVPISITCPGCSASLKATLGDMAAEKTLTCPNGHTVQLSNDETGGAKKAKKALDDLDAQLKKMGFR